MPVARASGASQASTEAPASLVSPARLAEFFAPKSIAVVGASETSGWARFLVASAATAGFTGPFIPVHPAHATVFGRRAARSLRDVGEPVDLAFIMVPLEAVEDVLDDAAAAGIRGAVVLASGYREVGEDGTALQDRLTAKAAGHGITLLGPNCLGFLNAHARTAPFALTIPAAAAGRPGGRRRCRAGRWPASLLSFARAHAIGVSTLTSLGNEAMIGTADVIDYLIEDERTKVICLFLEEIGDPAAFAAAAGAPTGRASRSSRSRRRRARRAARPRSPTRGPWRAMTRWSTRRCAS